MRLTNRLTFRYPINAGSTWAISVRNLPSGSRRATTTPQGHCTMREKVDKELDKLQEEGISSPVTNSSWAATVVPVFNPMVLFVFAETTS